MIRKSAFCERGATVAPELCMQSNSYHRPSALLELRQKHGISLERIADQTKIGLRYLQAIEDGDLNSLPGGVYTRSYLRQYAAAVDCDADFIFTMFAQAR